MRGTLAQFKQNMVKFWTGNLLVPQVAGEIVGLCAKPKNARQVLGLDIYEMQLLCRHFRATFVFELYGAFCARRADMVSFMENYFHPHQQATLLAQLERVQKSVASDLGFARDTQREETKFKIHLRAAQENHEAAIRAKAAVAKEKEKEAVAAAAKAAVAAVAAAAAEAAEAAGEDWQPADDAAAAASVTAGTPKARKKGFGKGKKGRADDAAPAAVTAAAAASSSAATGGKPPLSVTGRGSAVASMSSSSSSSSSTAGAGGDGDSSVGSRSSSSSNVSSLSTAPPRQRRRSTPFKGRGKVGPGLGLAAATSSLDPEKAPKPKYDGNISSNQLDYRPDDPAAEVAPPLRLPMIVPLEDKPSSRSSSRNSKQRRGRARADSNGDSGGGSGGSGGGGGEDSASSPGPGSRSRTSTAAAAAAASAAAAAVAASAAAAAATAAAEAAAAGGGGGTRGAGAMAPPAVEEEDFLDPSTLMASLDNVSVPESNLDSFLREPELVEEDDTAEAFRQWTASKYRAMDLNQYFVHPEIEKHAELDLNHFGLGEDETNMLHGYLEDNQVSGIEKGMNEGKGGQKGSRKAGREDGGDHHALYIRRHRLSLSTSSLSHLPRLGLRRAMQARPHTRAQTRHFQHTHTQTDRHTHRHTHTDTDTHTRTHTQTHTHTHTHTRTHYRPSKPCACRTTASARGAPRTWRAQSAAMPC